MAWTSTEILNQSYDSITQTLSDVSFEQKQINAGNHYYMEGYTSLDIAGVLKVALVTPDTAKWIHITWLISSNGILTAEFFEDAEGISGGSGVTPLNNNRNSSNASAVTLTSGISSTGDGTLISKSKWGGTGFKTVSGGAGIRGDMLILKQDTTYMRKFTSGSDTNVITFKATWFEYTHA